MTKYKAQIRFAEEPLKMIKWFTHNFDKEVGAFGIGELVDGELYIEKLVFPTQIVNGAHVHFKPEDWGSIIPGLTDEEIGKICFYWHTHPGSASASAGDEEDTFDVIMTPESERKFFGFMQTAEKFNKDFEYEARIEMRNPVWCSITDVEITTDANDEIAVKCQKVIEEKITIGNASASDQPGVTGTEEVKETPALPQIETKKVNNKCIFEVKNDNGKLVLDVSPYLVEWLIGVIDSNLYSQYVRKRVVFIVDDDASRIIVQPQKKCVKKLFQEFKSIRDEMFLTADKNDQQSLEATITQDVYSEEEDIKASQNKHNSKHYGYATEDDGWMDSQYFLQRGY